MTDQREYKKRQYQAFLKFCKDHPSYDLDPRLHDHAGPITHGGYISHMETAKFFKAFKMGAEWQAAQQPAQVEPETTLKINDRPAIKMPDNKAEAEVMILVAQAWLDHNETEGE